MLWRAGLAAMAVVGVAAGAITLWWDRSAPPLTPASPRCADSEAEPVPCGPTLTGSVSDPDGRPIAGARIVAWRNDSCVAHRVVTRADGEFAVCGWPGRFHVQAVADATTAHTATIADVGKWPRHPFVLAPGRSVEGRAVDGDGEPVRAEVVAAGGDVASVRADARGRFRLEHVTAGVAELRCSAPGFIDTQVSVPAGATGPVECRMKRGLVVTGKVLAGGDPVAEASVMARLGDAYQGATTDAAGRFDLLFEHGGPLTFTVDDKELPGRPPLALTHDLRDVVLDVPARPARPAPLPAAPPGRASISGVVVDTLSAPVPALRVVAVCGGRRAGVDQAGWDGRFAFADLDGGATCTFRLEAPKHPPVVYRAPPGAPFPTVTLPDADSRVTGLRLVAARRPATVTGRVVDETGAPVAGIGVRATPDDTCTERISYTTTAADGTFAFGPLSDQRHQLTALGVVARPVDVEVGADDAVITLQRTTRIEGTISGFAKSPIVVVRGGGTFASAVVTGDRFVVEKAPRGRVVLTALAFPELDVHDLEIGALPPAPIALAPRAIFAHGKGLAVDDRGVPVVAANCLVGAVAGADPLWFGGQESDARGAFAFDVPRGVAYQLTCVQSSLMGTTILRGKPGRITRVVMRPR